MNRRWLMTLPMLLAVTTVQADQVVNMSELLRLPKYCWGTQQIRDVSGDPVPIEEYMKRYGRSYHHLHHYCWALNTENKVAITNPHDWKFQLDFVAMGDINYVLSQNKDPKFAFLPEIYTTKARILFKLDKAADAVPWLKKAIEANPKYLPAYARLSDYYAEKGDKAEAIKILNQGIAHSKHSDMLSRRLKELQGTNGAKPNQPAQ
jgi:tetratricopeptide (TPR) repeat protein